MLMTFCADTAYPDTSGSQTQLTEIPDHLHDLNSYAVFQIVKILHSKTMFPCFKKHCFTLQGLFHDIASKTYSIVSPFIREDSQIDFVTGNVLWKMWGEGVLYWTFLLSQETLIFEHTRL